MPVVVVVAWAIGAGVRLQTLWYDVVTFRSDASHVIATQESEGATSRISVLLLVFVGTGMLLVVALFAVRLRSLLRHDPVPVVAIAVMLGLDLLGVALSGSFWTPYLFVPLPGVALALAALVAHDHLDRVRHRVTPAAVGLVVRLEHRRAGRLDGCVGGGPGPRGGTHRGGDRGRRMARRPGAGLRRARRHPVGHRRPVAVPVSLVAADAHPRPGPGRPGEVLTGSNPPTWFVEATFINTWSELGTTAIQSSLIRKYAFVQTACDRYRIYHLNTVDPVEVDVDCSTPFRTIWGR